MAIKLLELPYALDALEPYISRETLDYHHGKHHKTYVDNLNKLLQGSVLEDKSLEEIVVQSIDSVFNNASQIYNHNFYWKGLSPTGGGQPKGVLLQAINKSFGSFDIFKEQFTKASISLFGSGWVWLVKNFIDELTIVSTLNANTPIIVGQKPLLTCDVWEHAYYIDYRNMRAKYIDSFWKIINWDFVEENLLADNK
jgi:superoxide dismutase, Fe-Mn family